MKSEGHAKTVCHPIPANPAQHTSLLFAPATHTRSRHTTARCRDSIDKRNNCQYKLQATTPMQVQPSKKACCIHETRSLESQKACAKALRLQATYIHRTPFVRLRTHHPAAQLPPTRCNLKTRQFLSHQATPAIPIPKDARNWQKPSCQCS